jgi:hypothetical protein
MADWMEAASSELREIHVRGWDGVVVEVDRRCAHQLVVVAKPLALESESLAGISIGFSLFTKFRGMFVGRR